MLKVVRTSLRGIIDRPPPGQATGTDGSPSEYADADAEMEAFEEEVLGAAEPVLQPAPQPEPEGEGESGGHGNGGRSGHDVASG